MIKKSFIFLGVILLMGSVGCTDLGSLFSVKVETDFKIDVPVDVSAPLMKTGPFAFDATKVYDPLSNADLEEYKDQIGDIDLSAITGTIKDLSESTVLTETNLKVSGNGSEVSWDFDNVTLSNGTELSLPDEGTKYTTLSSILKSLEEVTVELSGNSSVNNVTYTLELKLSTTLTVGL
ncbi:MAG: hypothetical protein HN352_14845 [Bacteroidetes bacterium]|jgi:hypothetical protein|nr:hypothetical protein [Bacteroidota bacterium]MBT4402055.1 hypothetical protein [Bacteroidota bacterium]MBT4409432.1 hypothetical protein [Bacteroidota bacterium]MBT5425570.1 hypothetical protein [Bacteroidota bacterium]MBT7093543.1 hypothetical protein [Bacteroidota bacterium]